MGFLSRRRNKIIEKEIRNAYLLKGKLHDTNIYWQAFERFAQEHGGRTDKHADGGQDTAFEMTIESGLPKDFLKLLASGSSNRGTKVKVMAVRDRLNRTASIKVEKLEDFKKSADRLSEKFSTKPSFKETMEAFTKPVFTKPEDLKSLLGGIIELGESETTVQVPFKIYYDFLLKYGKVLYFEEGIDNFASVAEGLIKIQNKMRRIKFTEYTNSETKINILKN
mgnify:CR=1 FL=1